MIRELTQNLNIVSALENEPNDEGGLSAIELKAKFDESGNTIKDYINESLIPDVTGEINEKVSAAQLAAGNLPNGGKKAQVLAKNSDADYDMGFISLPKSVDTLNTARAIQIDLESTKAAAFDGAEDILPGVTGVLPLSSGGTGADSAEGAALALGRGIGACTTAAATAAKTASLPGFTRVTGSIVGVTFANINTAANPTLDINETGAAAVVDSTTGLAVQSSKMASGTHFFQFNGTGWILINPTSRLISGTVAHTNSTTSTATVTLGFTPSVVICQLYYSDTLVNNHYTTTFAALQLNSPRVMLYNAAAVRLATLTPTTTGFTHTTKSSSDSVVWGTLHYAAFS